MKRWIATLAGAGAIASLALIAGAGDSEDPPRGDGPRRGDGPGWHMAIKALDLNQTQKAAWLRMLEEHRSAVEPLQQEQRRLHDTIREQLEGSAPDAQQIGELTISGHRLMLRLRESREQLEKGLVGLLDESQQARFEMLKELRESVGQRGGRHGGPFGHGPRRPFGRRGTPQPESDGSS